nr:unnamed protein product [Digitaria exilis]
MAGKTLSFAVLLSFVILAAGSISLAPPPVDVQVVSPPPADVEVVSSAPLQTSSATATGTIISNDNNECVYTVYVKTGWIWKAGTDSVISLGLFSADGAGFTVPDMAKWGGLMGAGHDYYERGHTDIFSGRGPCLASAPCALNLTSDGTGAHHGWYCESVEVTAAAPHAACARARFGVDQWLARDAPPYQLHAERNVCHKKAAEE